MVNNLTSSSLLAVNSFHIVTIVMVTYTHVHTSSQDSLYRLVAGVG
jgi:hypothetical protein